LRRATLIRNGKRANLPSLVSVLVVLGLLSSVASLAGCDSAASDGVRPKRLVWIVVDGTHLDFDLAPMPFFSELIARGTFYSQAWVGQAPNNTPASHASFGTGRFPSHHGVLDFLWRTDPGRPSDPVEEIMTNFTVYTGGEPVWEQMAAHGATGLAEIAKDQAGATVFAVTSEKGYAIAPWIGSQGDVIVFPSHWLEDDVLHVQAHAAIGFEPPDPAFVDGWARDYQVVELADYAQLDTWATDVAIAAVQSYRPDVLLINLSQTDEIGHKTGGLDGDNPDALAQILANVDRQVERLWQAYADLGLVEETLFVVCTDHAISQTDTMGPYDALNEALASIGLREVSQGPREQMWLSDPAKAQEAAKLLVREFPDYLLSVSYRDPATSRYTTLLAEDVPQEAEVREALDYLFNATAATPQAADLRIITRRPNGTVLGQGRHYNTTWPLQHIWMILAGPGVRPGYESSYPARVVDLLPTLAALLYPDYEGTWDGIVLADALEHSSRQARASQAGQAKTMQRYQEALMALERHSR